MYLSQIYTKGPTRMLSFGNADGKRWLIPTADTHTALMLYQPSSLMGKLLKALLPLTARVPLVHRVLGAKVVHCRLSDDILLACKEAFGVKKLRWALFGGTPSAHTKPTLQIWNSDRILGYVKLTDSEDLYQALFCHERDVLDRLNKAGVKDIPQVLACKQLKNGLYIFIQTTQKTRLSYTVHKWNTTHSNFIDSLEDATRRRVTWKSTSVYASIEALRTLPLAATTRALVDRQLAEIRQDETVESVTSHGDFTPWNICFQPPGRLFVFDWEYAVERSLPGLDRMHFMLQTAWFEGHQSPQETFCEYAIERPLLRLYLLDIFSRYYRRGDGEDTPLQRYRLEILSML